MRTPADVEALLPAFAEREAADPESYPAANVADLHAARVIAGPLAASLGGRDWDLPTAVAVTEAVAGASASTALIMAMPLGLAGIYAVGPDMAPEAYRGTWARQIEAVAKDYREGAFYAACNSEKGAGGSLDSMKTVARRDEEGLFRLTGEKILASSGRYADWFFSTGKVDPAELQGAGVVEFFLVDVRGAGVEVLDDWDGFGMRSTESQTVRYENAVARELLGWPNFLATMQPLQYWFCLFAAIPLGCAGAMLRGLGDPAPQSPALRVRLNDAMMRYESLRAYLLETAAGWRPGSDEAWRMRVLRTKTYVSQESTKLCAELFALGGGRHYRRSGSLARALADSFAGTALRPPLSLALDQLTENFSPGARAGIP